MKSKAVKFATEVFFVAMMMGSVFAGTTDFPSVAVHGVYRAVTLKNFQDIVDGNTAEAQLAFGENLFPCSAGTVDRLFVAYGKRNGSSDESLWEHIDYVDDVSAEDTDYTVEIPEGFGSRYTQLAYILVRSFADTADLYNQTGLVGQWDAYENAGRGVAHATNPATWVDLTGNHTFAVVGTPVFENDCVRFDEFADGFRCDSQTLFDGITATDAAGVTVEVFAKPIQAQDRPMFSFGYSDGTHRTLSLVPDEKSGTIISTFEYRMSTYSSTFSFATINEPIHVSAEVFRDDADFGDYARLYTDQNDDGVMLDLLGRRKTGNTEVDSQEFSLGAGCSRFINNAKNGMKMDIYTVRLYTRPLTVAELNLHDQIDKERFLNGKLGATDLMSSSEVATCAAATEWGYNAVSGVISDGKWELGVSANGSELTIVSVVSAPQVKSVNLALPVVDANGGSYAITAIADNVFKNLSNFANVDNPVELRLPTGLRSIGASAFEGCIGMVCDASDLRDVTHIKARAFYGCLSLYGDLEIGTKADSLEIGNNAFGGYYNGMSNRSSPQITSVVLSDKLLTIPDNCFDNCKALTNAVFSPGLVSIGTRAFGSCSRLKVSSLDLPMLTTIGSQAFYGCDALCPAGVINFCKVTSIGAEAFRGDLSLTNDVVIGTEADGPVTIASGTFRNWSPNWNRIHSVTLGDGVTTVPANFCEGCIDLESVQMPKTMENVGAHAFYGCASLGGNIAFGKALSILDDGCFGCDPDVPLPYVPLTLCFKVKPEQAVSPFLNRQEPQKLRVLINHRAESWLDELSLTPWSEIDPSLKDAYAEDFHTKVSPLGALMVDADWLPAGTWIASWYPNGTMIIVH